MICHENVRKPIRKWFQVLSRFMVNLSFIVCNQLQPRTSQIAFLPRCRIFHITMEQWNTDNLLFTIICILRTEFLYDEDILWMTILKQRKSLYMFHIPQTDTQIPGDMWQEKEKKKQSFYLWQAIFSIDLKSYIYNYYTYFQRIEICRI